MKSVLLLLFSLSASAQTFHLENGFVQPFVQKNYPLKSFIKDYAKLFKVNVTYPSSLIPDTTTVHVELNSKASLPEFKKVFYELLANSGFSPQEEGKILWINNAADMRYQPSGVYIDGTYPKDASFSLVMYKLKFPLSSEVARNLRPLMSRYGRVIDLSDAKSIIIHDQGANTERLIATIQNMDTEANYQAMIEKIPEHEAEEKNQKLERRILELELEKKELEQRYVDLKGSKS